MTLIILKLLHQLLKLQVAQAIWGSSQAIFLEKQRLQQVVYVALAWQGSISHSRARPDQLLEILWKVGCLEARISLEALLDRRNETEEFFLEIILVVRHRALVLLELLHGIF